jgi:hypothetical protein
MTQQLLNDLVPLLIPLIVALAIWLYQFLLEFLPARQRISIDHIVRMVVRQVEQTMENMPSDEKKQAATTLAAQLFSALHLPIPDEQLLDAAIEAAVYELTHLPPITR